MKEYVFNYGLESAKIMNSIYSISESLLLLKAFLTASESLNNSFIINPIKSMLPQSTEGITGSLFLQPTINFSYSNGEYYLSSGSYSTQNNILASDDLRFSKLTTIFTDNSYVLGDELIFETVNNIKSYDYDQYFTLNYSRYDDGVNIVFKSNKNNSDYINNFIGYSNNTYVANYAQTAFGSIISAYINSTNESSRNLDNLLRESYKEMIAAFSNFADRSYSRAEVLETIGEYSSNIIDAFEEFANINLNV